MIQPPSTRQTGCLLLGEEEITYHLLRHPLRKRLTLSVNSTGEIEVRSPWRLGLARVEAFIREQEAWLKAQRDARRTVELQRPLLADGAILPLLDEWLTLRIAKEEVSRIRRVGNELWVPPPLTSGGLESMLERWYRDQARLYLTTRLRQRAQEMGVSVYALTIRSQKSRWGSCSSRGAINLNWQLLLLPTKVVEYVIVHELCHRFHMNHSPEFWFKVQEILPDFMMLRRQLKTIQINNHFW
ncbi:MAG: M48 family metallopeptidase [Magnetococcales bacterium]|nr:M48 family metallopeptidase [Magnetococcales bacterium]